MNWVWLMYSLKKIGADRGNKRLISKLYTDQKDVISASEGDSEPGLTGQSVARLFIIFYPFLSLGENTDD